MDNGMPKLEDSAKDLGRCAKLEYVAVVWLTVNSIAMSCMANAPWSWVGVISVVYLGYGVISHIRFMHKALVKASRLVDDLLHDVESE